MFWLLTDYKPQRGLGALPQHWEGQTGTWAFSQVRCSLSLDSEICSPESWFTTYGWANISKSGEFKGRVTPGETWSNSSADNPGSQAGPSCSIPFLLSSLTLFPEQLHSQNSNIYILLQLVWSFPFCVSLKGHLPSDDSQPLWQIHSNPREVWPGLLGPENSPISL